MLARNACEGSRVQKKVSTQQSNKAKKKDMSYRKRVLLRETEGERLVFF